MTNALIIFIKNAVLGKVKTRLASSVGKEDALSIYKKLLQHTCLITKNIVGDKYLFYSEQINDNDLWENDIFEKYVQSGDDLGERMKNAFELIFKKDYQEIVIIGSDCYELNEEIIQEAFYKLKEKDVVIGPAKDGGYYLLGMNVFIPQLFEGKKWSSGDVFNQTVKDLKILNFSFCQLPLLSDVDTAEDVNFSY